MTSDPASIVVCTHRHPPELIATIDSIDDQTPDDVELILVRSETTEDAPLPAPLAERVDHIRRPFRTVCVANPGVALARSEGLMAATSDVTLFVDDDTVARPGWFLALRRAMQGERVAAAGGTIHPQWPKDRPPWWLSKRLLTYYGARVAGPAATHPPFGANMALRRSMVESVGGFSAMLGHRGLTLGLHEETYLCERLEANGFSIGEAPAAVVEHRVRPEQLKVGWVLRRAWWEGDADARRDTLRMRRDSMKRLAKLAALLAALPLSLPSPRTAIYVMARILVNLGYLRRALWTHRSIEPRHR